MISRHQLHFIFVISAIFFSAIAALVLKTQLVPGSFGVYGPYRADAIKEEAQRAVRHATSASCFNCHQYEATIHLEGKHRSISCEFCHGTYADHISGGKKIASLTVKRGQEITTLCLRCHNTEIKARPTTAIKTVAMPEHLQNQHVKITHICNQCHHVHSPLKYINEAKRVTGLMEEES